MKLIDDLKLLWKVLSPQRRKELFGLSILTLIGSGAELVTLGAIVPFIGIIADKSKAMDFAAVEWFLKTFNVHPEAFVVAVSIAFAVIITIATFIRLLLLWYSNRFVYGMGHDIGKLVFTDTLARPYDWHTKKNSSEILGGMQKVQITVQSYILPLINGFVSLILALGIILMLVAIDPVVAVLGAGAFGGFYMAIALSVRKRIRENGIIIAKSNNERIQQLQESLGGIRDVIIDSTQSVYLTRFIGVDSRLRKAQAAYTFLANCPRLAIEGLGMMVIAGFALLFSQTGDLSSLLPTLGALGLGAQKLMPLIQTIYIAWSSTESNRASLHDVLHLIEPEGRFTSECVDVVFRSSLYLDCITYSHVKEATKPTLKNITLKIKKGSCIGIVGKTGSGKSTLVDLCMGLLLPDSGSIKVDGVPLNSNSLLLGWRKHIAHVPQTIFLADATIGENIAFGVHLDLIDRERLMECAKAAEISSYILSLPNGFDTAVGERGVKLSGGQRQRIGIARALYKKADFLVLDEATSALDTATEKKVIQNILEASSKITILMVAHRLSTLKNSHLIIELAQGELRCIHSYEEMIENFENVNK